MQWQTASGIQNMPCTNGVFHYYDCSYVAMLLNPIHANIIDPKLWQFETKQELGHDGLKGWCKEARVTHAIALPSINLEQRIEFAIRCAMIVCKNSTWNNWAKHWLENTDRSIAAAKAAAAITYDPYHIVSNVTAATKAAAKAAASADADAAVYSSKAAAYAAADAIGGIGGIGGITFRIQITNIINKIFF
jgi:hypothetical protein